jgi:hypothetical protein
MTIGKCEEGKTEPAKKEIKAIKEKFEMLQFFGG